MNSHSSRANSQLVRLSLVAAGLVLASMTVAAQEKDSCQSLQAPTWVQIKVLKIWNEDDPSQLRSYVFRTRNIYGLNMQDAAEWADTHNPRSGRCSLPVDVAMGVMEPTAAGAPSSAGPMSPSYYKENKEYKEYKDYNYKYNYDESSPDK